VNVTECGYEPSSVPAQVGQKLALVFKRISDKGCGGEVVFPAQHIRKELPLNQEVVVEITPKENESISFTCGMGMLKGTVVASR
jgi:plastocyanin domain-containing protein